MKGSFVIFICFVLIQSVFSQPKSSVPGYIITVSNDTIFGNVLVNNKGNVGYVSSIKFWNPTTQKVISYRADKTKAFGYGERYFESLIWQDAHYYFERIVKGSPASLYVTPSTSPAIIVPIAVTHNEYYLVDNSSTTRLNRLGFRKFMMNYVKQCPELVNELETQKLNFEDLIQIIQEYNLCSGK